MIRYAKISEIPDILDITKRCAMFMIQNGIHQWNDEYPSKDAFERDIQRNELFVLEKSKKVIGTQVVSNFMDQEYATVKWLTPNSKNVYIHRLAVDPMFHGKGFARQLMEFAENTARENDMISIRLDTFSQNNQNQEFYEQRGYRRLADIFYPKQSEHPFHCYELVL